MLDYRALFEHLDSPPPRTVAPWNDRHPRWHRAPDGETGDIAADLEGGWLKQVMPRIEQLPPSCFLASACIACDLAVPPDRAYDGADDRWWVTQARRLASETLDGAAALRGISELTATLREAGRHRTPGDDQWLIIANELLRSCGAVVVRESAVSPLRLLAVAAHVATREGGDRTHDPLGEIDFVREWWARTCSRFAVRTDDISTEE